MTAPLGLPGELSISTLVREVMRDSMSSTVGTRSCSSRSG